MLDYIIISYINDIIIHIITVRKNNIMLHQHMFNYEYIIDNANIVLKLHLVHLINILLIFK